MEEEEQEQGQEEAAEEVIWEVYHYRADWVGIPMADHLRAMVLRLGYDKCDNPPRKIPYYRLRPIHFGH
jgi:hypothetical protein